MRLMASVGLFALLTLSRVPPGVISAQEGSPAGDPARDELVFTKVCSGCHAADNVKDSRRSREQWEQVVEKMAAEGAKMTDADYEAVMRTLLSRYGRVNVNTAPAEDILAVVGLKKDDADRIVAYRTANGKFADFDALTKVPSIDVDRLNGQRASIQF